MTVSCRSDFDFPSRERAVRGDGSSNLKITLCRVEGGADPIFCRTSGDMIPAEPVEGAKKKGNKNTPPHKINNKLLIEAFFIFLMRK